ncbi:class I SAM-dependent methyltransferase [Labrys wisconsinensis]|uniref:S-adenosylmethionine-diacylgycerolhomoserine-N-methyltransferase n=1 Tax=Labrys wisconsinensis TaxID=425677 RepID=A0ABU0JJ83_9HYPH|nr:class I SAM-dependent methyltransferase [Labrys wisconsinensis]MDQ0473670.1 S-adenosylmethionine-diacylgycerolhomoserine-N-methyltransferase [Labrys wisconsinensis]
MTDHAPLAAAASAAEAMDGIYRWQRWIYDLTRKYYLLGRDRLIADLDAADGASVLEIGCGTGRNLVAAARRYPDARLHGFDISGQMLDTARRALLRRALKQRVTLGRADATTFDPAMFGRPAFERLYISYTLSMIPGWRLAAERAAAAIAPGGKLLIVDFGQQEGLPRWFKALLFAWLRRFHVHPSAELPGVLADIAERHGLALDCRSLYRGYAVYAVLRRPT